MAGVDRRAESFRKEKIIHCPETQAAQEQAGAGGKRPARKRFEVYEKYPEELREGHHELCNEESRGAGALASGPSGSATVRRLPKPDEI